MKLTVQEFSVEAESTEDAARAVARHFGCIADGLVPDSGVAIAHTIEGPPPPMVFANAEAEAAYEPGTPAGPILPAEPEETD